MNNTDDAAAPAPLALAARTLGISTAAVRQRIRRGSLPAEKRDGRWYVGVGGFDATESVVGVSNVTTTRLEPATVDGDLVEALRDEVVYLRHALDEHLAALREKDALIAGLIARLLAFALPESAPRLPTRAETSRMPDTTAEGDGQ